MKIKKNTILISSIYAGITFMIMYASVSLVLKQSITFQNILAYSIFSLIIAIIVGIFLRLKHNYGLIIFTISYVLAFGMMVITFTSELSGWNDLIGFLQMLMTLGVGFAIGLAVETIVYFKERPKQDRKL